nr:MAG TPA: hypothetical protein [Caudoviricetes sp.]
MLLLNRKSATTIKWIFYNPKFTGEHHDHLPTTLRPTTKV